MSTKKTVLATGPHPDDYEFGCSGTLLRHKKRGDKVYALILTYGHCTDKCLMKTRKIESIKAAEILGLDDIFFAELPFSDIRTSHNHVAKVEKYIKQLNPDVVYAISPNDWHPDHEHGGKIIRSAARGVQNVLYYAGSTNTVFNPGIYVDITDFMDKKIAAIIKHEKPMQMLDRLLKENVLSYEQIIKSVADNSPYSRHTIRQKLYKYLEKVRS